jgi:ATP-binding cassette subfamily B protein/subfamily B ATP-binding cassette protein MsbA
MAVALVAATIAAALRLLPPAITGLALDHVLGAQRLPPALAGLEEALSARGLLALIAGGLVAVAIVATAIGTWGRYLNTLALRRFQTRLRRRVFAHALRLPLHRLRAYRSGGLSGLLREDVAGTATLLSAMVYNPWRAVAQLAGTLAALAVIEWRVVVAVAVLLPPVHLVHRLAFRRVRPVWREIRLLRRRIDARTTEVFGGIRVIRSFGRQRTEAGRHARSLHLMQRHEMLAWWLGTVVEVAWSLGVPLGVAALVWYGGGRILGDAERVAAGLLPPAQAFTTGTLVTFVFYLTLLLEPMAVLATTATGVQGGLAALDRVLDVLEETPEFAGSVGTLVVQPEDVAGRVTLRGVRFQYPGRRRPALEGITLDVPAGQVVALVGRSGAGKSTLCDVIARFHDPTDGVVELDGIDIRKIELASYRRLIGMVEQDVFLFEGTIAENIAYGVRDAGRADVVRAAGAALAAEFIEALDEGYDTLVGERGARLSGGQRKRLAIARALLADPRILVLDEATSELDATSERLIHQSLATLMRGRTVFVIAHRLSTVAHADRIVVLERGRVVAHGRHAELLAESPAYRDLVDAQLLDIERPDPSRRSRESRPRPSG